MLDGYFNRILEIIVFDALIGNGDRHQENWAFIGEYSMVTKSLNEIEYNIKSPQDLDKLPKVLGNLIKRIFFIEKGGKIFPRTEMTAGKLTLHKNLKFAPIYDNGSSLCRECTEDKIDSMIKNSQEVEAYLRKGLAEIHWDGGKINHFNLIENICKTTHQESIKRAIDQMTTKYNPLKFNEIVVNLDKNLPSHFNAVKIPDHRKQLIVKLVSLRAQKLRDLLK